jgi:hypothetical protein
MGYRAPMARGPNPITVRAEYPARAAAPDHVMRACFATAVARARRANTAAVLSELYPSDDVAPRLLVSRAAASVGTSTTATFAAELAATGAVVDFLGSLGPASAAGWLIQHGPRVNLDGVASLNVPARSTAATVPAWVSELSPIAVRQETLANVTVGPSRKLGVIVTASRELYKRSDAANIFNVMLRENAAAGLDSAYLSASPGDAAAHAGLLYGAVSQPGIPGGDDLALRSDLNWLIDQVAPNGSGEVAFVMSNSRAIKLSLRTDVRGTFLASSAIADDVVVGVDPLSVVHGIGAGDLDIHSSEGASLVMADPAAPVVAGVTGHPVRDLFSTATIATRLLLSLAFSKRRSDCVAYVTDVSW